MITAAEASSTCCCCHSHTYSINRQPVLLRPAVLLLKAPALAAAAAAAHIPQTLPASLCCRHLSQWVQTLSLLPVLLRWRCGAAVSRGPAQAAATHEQDGRNCLRQHTTQRGTTTQGEKDLAARAISAPQDPPNLTTMDTASPLFIPAPGPLLHLLKGLSTQGMLAQ